MVAMDGIGTREGKDEGQKCHVVPTWQCADVMISGKTGGSEAFLEFQDSETQTIVDFHMNKGGTHLPDISLYLHANTI